MACDASLDALPLHAGQGIPEKSVPDACRGSAVLCGFPDREKRLSCDKPVCLAGEFLSAAERGDRFLLCRGDNGQPDPSTPFHRLSRGVGGAGKERAGGLQHSRGRQHSRADGADRILQGAPDTDKAQRKRKDYGVARGLRGG